MIIFLKEARPVSSMQENCHTHIANTETCRIGTSLTGRKYVLISNLSPLNSFLFYILKQHSVIVYVINQVGLFLIIFLKI